MTAIAITGMGLTGVLRITWVQDNLAHVLDHSHTDETSGTWTGLSCPSHGLPLGTDVDDTTLRHLAAGGEIADLIWEAPDDLAADHGQVFLAAMHAHHAGDTERAGQLWENLQAIWSQAWSANYAALEFMQGTGLTRFAPVKPQHWVVASFEHHTSPHGLPRPHIHNIAIPSLTTGANVHWPRSSSTLRVVCYERVATLRANPSCRDAGPAGASAATLAPGCSPLAVRWTRSSIHSLFTDSGDMAGTPCARSAVRRVGRHMVE